MAAGRALVYNVHIMQAAPQSSAPRTATRIPEVQKGPAGRPHNPDKPWFDCTPFAVDYFDRAEQRFVNEVELAVSPARLFEIFEDEVSWTVWVPGITRVEWTSDKPYGVGTTRTVTFVGGMEVYEDFIEWKAGELMAFTFYGTTQDVWERFGELYEVTDLGGDRCRLRWTVGYAPRGVFKLIHPLVKPLMGFVLATFLKKLQAYCDSAG